MLLQDPPRLKRFSSDLLWFSRVSGFRTTCVISTGGSMQHDMNPLIFFWAKLRRSTSFCFFVAWSFAVFRAHQVALTFTLQMWCDRKRPWPPLKMLWVIWSEDFVACLLVIRSTNMNVNLSYMCSCGLTQMFSLQNWCIMKDDASLTKFRSWCFFLHN